MKNWFEERGLDILDYQVETVEKVSKSLETEEITILGACPSSGKTKMTIYCLEEYFKKYPDNRVLVLAHGTTILRSQFHDVLVESEPGYSYQLVENFKQYDKKKQVNVSLPQTLMWRRELPKVDLLIVDEAHHFYFAEMIKKIIKKTKPSRQLLLTGTPSVFIGRGYPIIPVTLNTVYDQGRITDVGVEVATSSYSFEAHDYNRNQDLRTTVKMLKEETDKTLDGLMEKITGRLYNKTMFVCRSQVQAKQVQQYFKKIGLDSALSTTDTDRDSKEIKRFREGSCLILIVVFRGILGFDYPELVNIVDMSVTMNIDRLFQMFCRLTRIHPRGVEKTFLKIAPSDLGDYCKYIMTGVFCLCDEKYYTKFNGRNFSGFKIPVLIEHKNFKSGEGKTVKNRRRYLPINFDGLPAMEFFKSISKENSDELLDSYAYATIGEARAKFLNKSLPKNYWTKELCVVEAHKYSSLIEWYKNSPGSLSASKRLGCYEECRKGMRIRVRINYHWTREKVLESALRYSTIKEWNRLDKPAYSASFALGITSECTKHMKKLRSSLTLDECKANALQFKSPSEWQKKGTRFYSYARRYGWYEECTAHMMKKEKVYKYTLDECKANALNFQTPSEWQKKALKFYSFARSHRWMDECTGHMKRKLDKKRTLNECKENALLFKSKKEWKNEGGKFYAYARTHGWLDECTKHMKAKSSNENFNQCRDNALLFKTRKEWVEKGRVFYNKANNNKWLEECTKHMGEKLKEKHTLDECKVSALRFASRNEWKKNEKKFYIYAQKHGWLDKCRHMGKPRK